MIDRTNYSIDCFHDCEITGPPNKLKRDNRMSHLKQSISSAQMPGHKMEFGVWKGTTITEIARRFPNDTIWGFDSFEGLPEPWYTDSRSPDPSHPAGYFGLSKLPSVPPNVNLVKGWFNETLPEWLKEHSGPVSLLHIDCDLYSSTATVLELLNDRIVPGTVILFDEMYPWSATPYDLWEEGEYRALGEWLEKHDRAFRPLLRSKHQQCSLVVLK